jgi:hydrogenase expression/formation protein HypC
MCLGVPGRVVRIDDPDRMLATVEVSGVRRSIHLDFVVDGDDTAASCLGAWVLVHVGFAMSRIDEAEAAEMLRILAEIGELEPGAAGGGGP